MVCVLLIKYSILKYISSFRFGYPKQHCSMGITSLKTEIKPKNILKYNVGMICLKKEGRDVRLLSY